MNTEATVDRHVEVASLWVTFAGIATAQTNQAREAPRVYSMSARLKPN